jgi:hypothetical protein
MASKFQVFGPFKCKKDAIADRVHQKSVWQEIEERFPGLSNAHGVYLFSLRNKSNYKPVYVGKTARTFKVEAFNSNNLVKFLAKLKGQKGTLCLHLLAKPKLIHSGFAVVSGNQLDWMEVFILFLCRQKNPAMLNKSHTKFLSSVEISGITSGFVRGRTPPNLATFRNATSLR